MNKQCQWPEGLQEGCDREGLYWLSRGGAQFNLCRSHEQSLAKRNIADGCGVDAEAASRYNWRFLRDPARPIPWLPAG